MVPLAGSDPFDPTARHSPLPRAYRWVDGSAYVNHVELVRRARGAEMPPDFWTDPLIYQGDPIPSSAPRPHLRTFRGLGPRPRGRSGSHHRRRSSGRHRSRGRAIDPIAHARERRVGKESDSRRTGQGLRLSPVETGLGVQPGGGDAGQS